MAYCTAEQVKSYLKMVGGTEDDLLDALIARAKGIIDAYTRRTFEAGGTEDVHYLDPTRNASGRILWLDADFCAILTVVNGDGAEVDSTEYVTLPRNATPYYAIQLKASAAKTWTYTTDPEGAIVVTGTRAYSATAPDDIVHVAIRLVSYLYNQRKNGEDLDRTVVIGAAALAPVDIPSDLRMMLRPYRRLV